VTIVHQLLRRKRSRTARFRHVIRSGAVRRPSSALMQRRLPSLSRDAMPSLREGAHTEEQKIGVTVSILMSPRCHEVAEILKAVSPVL
jgi:hypothetical protein